MSSNAQFDEMVVPDPKGLGAYVHLQREMLYWKQATLAAMAGVSVTTVERVERGETVRPATLEKIAVAFEMEPDTFTRPRSLLSEEEALANLVKSLDFLNHKMPVAVAPLRTEGQLRALATTHFLVLDTDLHHEAHDDLVDLREWIDLAAFMRPGPSSVFWRKSDRKYRVRDLYGDVFDHVDEMERRNNAVCLVRTYDAQCEDPTCGRVPIGLLCLRSRRRNPAAALLDQVWVEKSGCRSAALGRRIRREIGSGNPPKLCARTREVRGAGGNVDDERRDLTHRRRRAPPVRLEP